ncbi:MAG TPA: hypothetical protein VFJ75_08775 [Gaiellaceae bacterium]|nr:hypothetical protein [Gaiellaceae bacterium]
MIRDLYASLTAREQRALRWSAAATAAVLWLATAWADPRVLLVIPLTAGGFWLYRRRHRHDTPDDDPDFEY